MPRKVAFITGASRGIGACTAIQLAAAGYDVALTARTVDEGERHDHGSFAPNNTPLAGSLRTTAAAVKDHGGEALCLSSDILEPQTVLNALQRAQQHFGRIDLLFNNACYQGPGNQQRLLDISDEQIKAVYQGNVFTPLALVQRAIADMAAKHGGTIINMVSGSAINPSPAPVDEGGWGFAYPSSKAALIRMADTVRVEHSDDNIRLFNVDPGFVHTEVMKANGLDESIARRFNPTPPDVIAKVICWLAEQREADKYREMAVIYAPRVAEKLGVV